jgi:hypothetical protein
MTSRLLREWTGVIEHLRYIDRCLTLPDSGDLFDDRLMRNQPHTTGAEEGR